MAAYIKLSTLAKITAFTLTFLTCHSCLVVPPSVPPTVPINLDSTLDDKNDKDDDKDDNKDDRSIFRPQS